MIYVIGDTHGALYKFTNLINSEVLTKEDKIIIVGDFGFYFFKF